MASSSTTVPDPSLSSSAQTAPSPPLSRSPPRFRRHRVFSSPALATVLQLAVSSLLAFPRRRHQEQLTPFFSLTSPVYLSSSRLFLSLPPSSSSRHRHCCSRRWPPLRPPSPTHRRPPHPGPRPHDRCPVLLLSPKFSPCVSSSPGHPLPLATAVADVGLLSEHRPRPIAVLLHPDRAFTTPIPSSSRVPSPPVFLISTASDSPAAARCPPFRPSLVVAPSGAVDPHPWPSSSRAHRAVTRFT